MDPRFSLRRIDAYFDRREVPPDYQLALDMSRAACCAIATCAEGRTDGDAALAAVWAAEDVHALMLMEAFVASQNPNRDQLLRDTIDSWVQRNRPPAPRPVWGIALSIFTGATTIALWSFAIYGIWSFLT